MENQGDKPISNLFKEPRSPFHVLIFKQYESKISHSKDQYTQEQEENKLPENYVLYYTNLEQTKVRGIEIKDPSISLYGLSMNSSENFVNKTLIDMGFTYHEYYGRNPSYISEPG